MSMLEAWLAQSPVDVLTAILQQKWSGAIARLRAVTAYLGLLQPPLEKQKV